MRTGAGSDQNHVPAQVADGTPWINGSLCVRVFESGGGMNLLYLVRREIRGNFRALGGNDRVLMMHEVLDRKAFTQG